MKASYRFCWALVVCGSPYFVVFSCSDSSPRTSTLSAELSLSSASATVILLECDSNFPAYQNWQNVAYKASNSQSAPGGCHHYRFWCAGSFDLGVRRGWTADSRWLFRHLGLTETWAWHWPGAISFWRRIWLRSSSSVHASYHSLLSASRLDSIWVQEKFALYYRFNGIL